MQPPGQQNVMGNWVTFSQLRGHPLVDASKGQEVGEVQDVLLDQRFQGIQALMYKAGLFQGSELVPVSQARLGLDAVMFQPGTQTKQDRSAMSHLPKASDIIGRRVLTDTGQLLGVVDDLRFEQYSHRLLGIEVAPEVGGRERMGGRAHFLSSSTMLSVGPDAIMVSEEKLGGF